MPMCLVLAGLLPTRTGAAAHAAPPPPPARSLPGHRAVTACARLRRADVWRRRLHDGPAQRRMEGQTVSVTTYSSQQARGERPSFGDLLRRYRVAAGLSQEALAEQARMSARAISDLERGVKHAPRPTTVQLLAQALQLSDAERAEFIAAARHLEAPGRRSAVQRPG